MDDTTTVRTWATPGALEDLVALLGPVTGGREVPVIYGNAIDHALSFPPAAMTAVTTSPGTYAQPYIIVLSAEPGSTVVVQAPPTADGHYGAGHAGASQFRIGEVTVDLMAKRVVRPQRGEASRPTDDIRLTPTEWRLLEVFLRAPGKLLSRQHLLAEAWGPGYARATGNLRLYMSQLRRKLEPDPAQPRWLVTVPGMGYRFEPDPSAV